MPRIFASFIVAFAAAVGSVGCAGRGMTADASQLHADWKLVNFTLATRDRLRPMGVRVEDWKVEKGSVALTLLNEQLTVRAPNAEDLTIEELEMIADAILGTIAAERRNGRRLSTFAYRKSPSQTHDVSAIGKQLRLKFKESAQ